MILALQIIVTVWVVFSIVGNIAEVCKVNYNHPIGAAFGIILYMAFNLLILAFVWGWFGL